MTIQAKRSFARAGILAAGSALLAVMAGTSAGHAGPPSSAVLEQREQALQQSADGVDQRDKQAKTTADRQKQLLEYQVRKSQRTNQKLQCQSAGLPNC
jgi:hypothetical protein